MPRTGWLVALALLLAPGVAHALQLHWSSGADTLSFTEATRAILVLRADSVEVTLPPEWRLLWTADSTEVQMVAPDSLESCAGDTAQVYGVEGPATPEDSTEHVVTARFCSGGIGTAAWATYAVDLPGWGRGKFKVVALDPADSSRVIQSNEVTFNGGVGDRYSPVILQASSSRQAAQYAVTAIGSGLAAVSSTSLTAVDARWSVGLGVVSQTDSALTASAEIVADVPAGIFEAIGSSGAATAALGAEVLSPQNTQWAPSIMQEAFTQEEKDALKTTPPSGRIQPKDFALAYAMNKFHLFYIRLNMWDTTYARHGKTDSTEKNFGHAVSTDLIHWWDAPVLPRDTTVLQVRSGKWDNFHVWAPTIVQRDSFFMFYTGVTDTLVSGVHLHHQRIGLATSTDLVTWQQYDGPILRADEVPWADKGRSDVDGGSQQLRDPFVMPDPDHPSHWLMYFVAVDSAIAPAMAVGVARSLGNLFLWTADRYPLRATDSTRTHAKTVESPHVFEHENQWWLFLSVQHPRGGEPDGLPYNPVAFEWDSLGGPADTTTAQWTALDTLYNYNYPHPDPHLAYWHGSEYLPVGEHEYLAAYDDWNMGVAIGELNWYGPTDFVVGSASVANVGVPLARDAAGESVRLILLGTHPSRSGMQLGVSLPVSMRAQVTIFDVAGRRVKTIVDGDLPAGRTAAHWDGSDSNGKAVGSGVYLARLTCPWGNRIVKGVMLR